MRARKPKPWTGEAFIDRMLTAAGYQAKDLADSVQTLREALEANQPARYTVDGELVVDSGPDWQARITASKALIALPFTGYKRDPGINANFNGPVLIQWQPSLPSPTDPGPSKPNSTRPSTGNGHGPPALSATDDLASLS